MIATSGTWKAILDEDGARVVGPNYERDVTKETNAFLGDTLLRNDVVAEFMLEVAEKDFANRQLPGATYMRDHGEKYVIVKVK